LTYFKFLIYGLIQGFTEFLPISSTAHLKIFSDFLRIDDPGSSVSAILHLGSIFAILYYFRDDIYIYLKEEKITFKKNFINNKLIKSIAIGSISILFLGLIIKIFIPNFSDSVLRTNLSIAIISIFMAFLMIFADKSKKNIITLSNHNLFDSLKIGIGQALAIFPGVSRSGITISIALLLGWKKVDATKFSFFLGIPAISLAALVEFLDSFSKGLYLPFGPLVIGLVTTFFISFLCIDFLIKFIPKKGLTFFAYYRIIFGTIILVSYF
tara:strand:- start:259 stop:1062 length:804 start_codon:yes stop_codon:yes gene_type:complete